jgi:hypothetical protein
MYGFVSITIWSLTASNLEETNLANRLRMHGPKINRMIMVTKGLNKVRNQVRDGTQDLVSPHTCPVICISIDCFLNHLAL